MEIAQRGPQGRGESHSGQAERSDGGPGTGGLARGTWSLSALQGLSGNRSRILAGTRLGKSGGGQEGGPGEA